MCGVRVCLFKHANKTEFERFREDDDNFAGKLNLRASSFCSGEGKLGGGGGGGPK